MKRFCAALLAALCLLSGTVGAAESPANPFTDVPEDEWYTSAVLEIVRQGIMAGTDPGLFSPEADVTRAMVITVLWKLEGSPQPAGTGSFPDVSPNDLVSSWYSVPAAWAKEQGIAHGHDDGLFRGDDPVTREELAAFLYSYDLYLGEAPAEGSLGLFPDANQVSDWAVDPVRHAVGMGYLRGDENGLDPQGRATRAQLASILLRILTPAVG